MPHQFNRQAVIPNNGRSQSALTRIETQRRLGPSLTRLAASEINDSHSRNSSSAVRSLVSADQQTVSTADMARRLVQGER